MRRFCLEPSQGFNVRFLAWQDEYGLVPIPLSHAQRRPDSVISLVKLFCRLAMMANQGTFYRENITPNSWKKRWFTQGFFFKVMMLMGDIYIYIYICGTYIYIHIHVCTTANHQHTWQIVTLRQPPFGQPFQAQRVCQLRHRFGWGMREWNEANLWWHAKSGKVNSGRVEHGNKIRWKIRRIRTLQRTCVLLCQPKADLKTSGNLVSD